MIMEKEDKYGIQIIEIKFGWAVRWWRSFEGENWLSGKVLL